MERDAAGGRAIGGGCDAPILKEDAHLVRVGLGLGIGLGLGLGLGVGLG